MVARASNRSKITLARYVRTKLIRAITARSMPIGASESPVWSALKSGRIVHRPALEKNTPVLTRLVSKKAGTRSNRFDSSGCFLFRPSAGVSGAGVAGDIRDVDGCRRHVHR